MASTPYFILSPSTLLSLVGLFRGPDKTVPTPAEDWRQATVDVVIPAFNEERHIVRSLASLLNQTFKPRQIILVDDGSADETIDRARAFCAHAGVKLIAIKRRDPIGKTPTLKRQARDYDSDVEFVLNGDTVLESDNYIERTVQELYQAVGIASACGTILPMRRRDRRAIDRTPTIRAFNKTHPRHDTTNGTNWIRDTATDITNLYREVLYLFLQRVIYRGQMAFFGTISNPVGCAVAYRRRYVNAMFNYYTPKLGDDLTTSEDIFIGHAMLNEGYRNIQLDDVYARTVEPEFQRPPGRSTCGRRPSSSRCGTSTPWQKARSRRSSDGPSAVAPRAKRARPRVRNCPWSAAKPGAEFVSPTARRSVGREHSSMGDQLDGFSSWVRLRRSASPLAWPS